MLLRKAVREYRATMKEYYKSVRLPFKRCHCWYYELKAFYVCAEVLLGTAFQVQAVEGNYFIFFLFPNFLFQAVDAFAKGELSLAGRLLEEVHGRMIFGLK